MPIHLATRDIVGFPHSLPMVVPLLFRWWWPCTELEYLLCLHSLEKVLLRR